ncbi:MAG: hypothetical protein CMF31_01890 [Kordiimonas sp.]|nr:hypothetical protein [Kordiimonas sp.]|tara:strand:+ start:140 stop:841 length:702 start_codon:yes stop_codon:yes gene_type:complete
MSLGSSRQKERLRRRRRFWLGFFKWLFIVAVFAGMGYFAWNTGSKIARLDIDLLNERYTKLQLDYEGLQLELGKSQARVQELEKRVPDERSQSLLTLINKRLDEGLPSQRLAQVIATLSPTQKCEDTSQLKRFIVPTAILTTGSGVVSFEKGLLTVSGKGRPSLNAEGKPEAWYDPAQDVDISFTLPGGETQKISGTLPLHHTVILGDTEYRFTLSAGNRSFMAVALLKCSYP